MMEFLEFFFDNRVEVLQQLLEHIELTFISLFFASLVGISLGVFIAVKQKFANSFIGFVNVIQTIPSLALLGFLLPLFGIGVVPAIIALFLYALLPIVRNTYTGIVEVDASVKESAIAMGMNSWQILTKVELPLSLPYIMAGIKTASVINVGVATLSAFIAAGGLGKFILQGIQLNNTYMILAGAIPASLLALAMDASLGLLQKSSTKTIKWVLLSFTALLLVYLGWISVQKLADSSRKQNVELKGGFPSEFIYREDGLKGLFKKYDFKIEYVEMEIGLMYQALKEKEVDVISGFSTDGRIKAYNLKMLEDDENYFPPYEAAPMVRTAVLEHYPQLEVALDKLGGKISDEQMRVLNYEVDELKKQPKDVAFEFLNRIGLLTDGEQRTKRNSATIKIGSKAFTENYILAHIFKLIIEHHSELSVKMELGFGGTKLLMDAMKKGEIDLYPEYTGTALLLMLDVEEQKLKKLLQQPSKVYEFVNEQSQEQFGFTWLPPLGFNNTFAILMRENQAEELGIGTISDLAEGANE